MTAGYAANREAILELLRRSQAFEVVCWLRYTQHACIADGIRAEVVVQEFEEHADQELAHAKRLAERIVQLGGAPDFSPAALAASPASYTPGGELRQMIQENLIEERVAIDWYRAAVAVAGADDPTTRRLFEEILAEEEHHADDLARFLKGEHGK